MRTVLADAWTSPAGWVPLVALRDVVGDAAVYLMVGGLIMLGVVVGIVLARSVFPVRESSTAALEAGRAESMRQTPELAAQAAGRRVDGVPKPPTFASREDGLAWLEDNGFGRPRILRIDAQTARVRVYACSECAEGASGCRAQADRLAAALGAAGSSVGEVACRGDGDAACEFEVAFG